MNDTTAKLAQIMLDSAHRCEESGCPDADTLIAFADGRLPEAEREAVAIKVAACARCAAAVRVALDASAWADDLAADFERPADAGKVQALKPMPRRRPQTWIPLALAAGIAVFAVLGLTLRHAPVDEPLRGAVAVVTTPPDGAVLAQAPERLAWPCTAVASAAQVELLAADATLRWSGTAVECAATLPIAMREQLPPGEYLWRVKNAAGESVLGPVAFRIKP